MTRLSMPAQLCGHHPQGPLTMGLPIALTNLGRRTTPCGPGYGTIDPSERRLSDVLSAKFAVAGTLTQ